MAIMIPAYMPNDTPQSERIVFDRINLDPEAADWLVLHSVGLSKTRKGPYGEIDFVIFVPKKGVVCLEIKGGIVVCKNGVWTTKNQKTMQTSTLKKSPYMQAREGMFALRKAIVEKFGSSDPASLCPMSYAVVFPAIAAPPRSPGEEWWDTIDCKDLLQPISKIIIKNISEARKKLTITLVPDSVSSKTMSKIRQYLRPDFDRFVTRASTIRQSEERLISLTEAQYNYLDIAEENDRLLVEGAAGTGKTVLAIEHARREAHKKRKTILVCFNRVLASWLSRQFSDEEKKWIEVASFYSLLHREIAKSVFKEEFDEAFDASLGHERYSHVYPYFGELALTDRNPLADSLIIDEAQDLLQDYNLPLINLFVKSGMSKGRWVAFGDFTRQAIYSSSNSRDDGTSIKKLLGEFSGTWMNIPLRVNCRNTKQIGEETALLSGFDSLPYRLAHAEGLPVDYRYWKSQDDEKQQIFNSLIALIQDGVSPKDIVILAPNRFEKSTVSSVPSVEGIPITDLGDISGEPGGCVVFSTIHSFKGMESPVIVLCGITGVSRDEERALLYVGMSRARSQLVIVANEKVKKALPELTRRMLSEGWKV